MAARSASENRGSKRKPTRRQRAGGQLADELAGLRGVAADIVEHVRLDLEGGLAELRRAVTADAEGRAGIPVRNLETALKRVRALRVKPDKGRIKDLRRLEALVEELDELLGGGQ